MYWTILEADIYDLASCYCHLSGVLWEALHLQEQGKPIDTNNIKLNMTTRMWCSRKIPCLWTMYLDLGLNISFSSPFYLHTQSFLDHYPIYYRLARKQESKCWRDRLKNFTSSPIKTIQPYKSKNESRQSKRIYSNYC